MESLNQHPLRHQHVVDFPTRRLGHAGILIEPAMPARIAHEEQREMSAIALQEHLVKTRSDDVRCVPRRVTVGRYGSCSGHDLLTRLVGSGALAFAAENSADVLEHRLD